LRREVAVERAGRQAGRGEHVGDRHVGRALGPHHFAPARDQKLHLVAGPFLGPAHRALDCSVFGACHRCEHMHLRSETAIFTSEQVCYAAPMADIEPADTDPPETEPVATYRNSTFISTDSHVTEPIDLYAERVGRAFRDRVPRIEV